MKTVYSYAKPYKWPIIIALGLMLLELSVELIGNNNPGLASAISKAMAQLNPTTYDVTHQIFKGEMYFNAQLLETLEAHTIGKIVSALIEIGEQALLNHNLSIEYVTILRTLIDDWVQLTEWVLKNVDKTKTLH